MARAGQGGFTRRAFVAGAGALVAAQAKFDRPGAALAASSTSGDAAAALEHGVTRPWIGPDYWGNRLQDWRLAGGRIECVAASGQGVVRTVGVLTRRLTGDGRAQLRVRTGTLASGAGFSGLLIGAGAGELDPRAAALVQGVSGEGGGLLAVYDADGSVGFRDHTAEKNQFAFAPLPGVKATAQGRGRSLDEDVELRLNAIPQRDGAFRLELGAYDAETEALLASATVDGVAAELVRGGVALVSSEERTAPGARFWLGALVATGPGVSIDPEHAFGPIAGTLFSVSGSTLKVTAQLLPLGPTDPRDVRLEVRSGRGPWRLAARAPVTTGYAAQLRVDRWDTSHEWEYRVIYESSPRAEYRGTVPAEPRDRPLVIATINCLTATHRSLDSSSNGAAKLPGEHLLGLHTERNLYFPHAELAGHIASHEPDVLVVLGDQLYQNKPTAVDPSRAPELDFFYKYLLWLWSFGDLTRRIPSVVMVDDHDVFQGNIWGHAGAPAPGGDQNKGGYVNDAAWVNMLQRVECGHDPDPYDPTPVEQGIEVYYGAFAYGGVSFAFLEDRKFKNTDADNDPVDGKLELLGERQEAFLAAWRSMHPGLPKILLTQTTFACFQTDENGDPTQDFDSNGWPKTGRDAALRLIKDAGAVILSGDQHLGALIRHGIDDAADGPLQFASPAGGTSFQRWFEPAQPLANGTGHPNTGDFVDGFGNRLRALAVANPKVTFAKYRTGYPTGQGLGDRSLKSEGYGIARVDAGRGEYLLECWPWDVDPAGSDAAQFPGWPYRVPFSEA